MLCRLQMSRRIKRTTITSQRQETIAAVDDRCMTIPLGTVMVCVNDQPATGAAFALDLGRGSRSARWGGSRQSLGAAYSGCPRMQWSEVPSGTASSTPAARSAQTGSAEWRRFLPFGTSLIRWVKAPLTNRSLRPLSGWRTTTGCTALGVPGPKMCVASCSAVLPSR